MSIKSLLMPAITARMFARERLLAQRAAAERRRRAQGAPHLLRYFHQVDDPYSALVAQRLPQLLERYDVELQPHLVGPPADHAAPARDQLVAYSRRDAALLARHWKLDFVDTGRQPADADIERVRRQLVAAAADGRFADVAERLTRGLWQAPQAGAPAHAACDEPAPADAATTQAHVAAAEQLRQTLGHYLGAMFFYAGEWYWGLDRLHHLEQRLQDLGAHRPGTSGLMFPPEPDLDTPATIPDAPGIDFFLSLRSPYTAIVAQRVFRLGEHTGAPVRLRYVLPMVMRGLPVPREKRLYIMHDAAREAHLRGVPFGRINDPLGRPTERGMALIPLAERMGQGQAYVGSFLRGVWSEGIDAGSDRGLRRIAERAGLAWSDAQDALHDETWRALAEANRTEMFALGLWGVPSLRVGDTAVWGQDRLWAVQQAVLATRGARDTPVAMPVHA
ncbi:MAG: DsbA family protein [Rhodoferax sp.]|nr:DsbA family protein [Rhodoferax sp.]